MLPLLVAIALAVPFLHHRHHASPKPAAPVAATPKVVVPLDVQPPLVKLADPIQQELEQTQN